MNRLGGAMGVFQRLIAGLVTCAAGFGSIALGVEYQRGAAVVSAEEQAGPQAAAPMGVNAVGLAIIKAHETVALESVETGGLWRVGYGHSRTARPGMIVTLEEAELLLRADVLHAEDAVRRLVKIALNENEFSALVSFVFDVGDKSFARSELLARLNEGDRSAAAEAFLELEDDKGGRAPVRRERERALFLAPG